MFHCWRYRVAPLLSIANSILFRSVSFLVAHMRNVATLAGLLALCSAAKVVDQVKKARLQNEIGEKIGELIEVMVGGDEEEQVEVHQDQGGVFDHAAGHWKEISKMYGAVSSDDFMQNYAHRGTGAQNQSRKFIRQWHVRKA